MTTNSKPVSFTCIFSLAQEANMCWVGNGKFVINMCLKGGNLRADLENAGAEEDDVLGQIDWDNLFDGLPDSDNNIFELEPPLTADSQPIDDSSKPSSPVKMSSWIGDIETLLMQDDDDKVDQLENCNAFLEDILVDSPSAHESGGELLDASTDKDFTSSDDADGGPKEKDDGAEEKNNNDEEEDPDDSVSKKRRRQLRNKDAALRSRERKKMYVKDLEIKSRYLEGECRRLDRLLQCFIAENHALRLSLQRGNAFGVTSAKQESAVLLLESLLLGSLLWFLGIMCLFPLPAMPQSTLVKVLLETMENKAPENAALRGAGNVTISSQKWEEKPSRRAFGELFFFGEASKGAMSKEVKPWPIAWGSSRLMGLQSKVLPYFSYRSLLEGRIKDKNGKFKRGVEC
ncbi:unnamed protein product [Dovyalis caffra]|uniref:BZIP domain-containing protein n=1 Tax=Dovyalis caffra TaxID=77055 RepID=A0AAV1S3R4_9ROSI|nr:unnamed protein product [Dovyalis caffra]